MKSYSFDERVTLSTKLVTFASRTFAMQKILVSATGFETTSTFCLHQLPDPAHIPILETWSIRIGPGSSTGCNASVEMRGIDQDVWDASRGAFID